MVVLGRKISKDFKQVTKDEIKDIVTDIERNKDYSEWTKSGYKIAIKKFFQILHGNEWNSREFPELVKWIRSKARESKLDAPVILSKAEILKIFEVSEGIREKALCSFMYETGCRVPDELFHMKVSDVEFDLKSSSAMIKLKSGKVGTRKFTIVISVPHLRSWIDNGHPKPTPDSYLWVNVGTRGHGKVMGYSSLVKIVNKWIMKAGINKDVTPYTFRRTRYTHLAPILPTPILYKIMGQVQGSATIRRYLSLSTEDTEDAIFNFYGMPVKNNSNKNILPLFCPICKNQAPPEKQFCPQCNTPLTEMAKIKVEEVRKTEMSEMMWEVIKKNMTEEQLKEFAENMRKENALKKSD